MDSYCESDQCENPAATVVPVSVAKPGDEERRYCKPCESAYSTGVQHGVMTALGGIVVEVKGGCVVDVRCETHPHYPLNYTLVDHDLRDDEADSCVESDQAAKVGG